MEYKFRPYMRTGFVHSEPGEDIRIEIDIHQINQTIALTGQSFDEVFAEFLSHEHIHHICYQLGGKKLCKQFDNICSNWIYNNVNIDTVMRTQHLWDGGIPRHKAIKAINWMQEGGKKQ